MITRHELLTMIEQASRVVVMARVTRDNEFPVRITKAEAKRIVENVECTASYIQSTNTMLLGW